MAMSTNVYLSIGQLEERLNTSRSTIYRWKASGRFPKAVKLGPGTVRWRLSDIEAWETSCIMTFSTVFS